jgi:hypothetical protein
MRAMWRGRDWTEEEEALCYSLFIRFGLATPRLDNSVVFNSLWADIAGRMTESLGKEVRPERVRVKIHMLRMHFNTFRCYRRMPGVHLDKFTGKITVTSGYMAHLNVVTLFNIYNLY